MARTDTLGNFLTDVAEAIRTKKGTTDTIQASNLDTEIANLSGGGKFAPRWLRFSYYIGTELDAELANLDTSNMTSMQTMFNSCTNLPSLDLSSFNTSNVTTMYAMFNKSSALTSIDLSSFDTSNVTTMYGMFQGCSALTSLDLSNFDTTNVTNMAYMFDGCTSLQSIDIRGFDFTNVSSHTAMFQNVQNNCAIIVKDDTAKTWITTNFIILKNVKTVAEYEASV